MPTLIGGRGYYVEPPYFQVPHAPSFGETVVPQAGFALANVMATVDAEEERRKKEEEHQFGLDRLMREIAMQEALQVQPGSRPTTTGLQPVQTRAVGGSPGQLELGPPTEGRMETQFPADESTTIPPLTFRGRTVVPSRRVPRLYESDVPKEGTEVLSQEAWSKLPEFYKARWQPGQRVPSTALGSVGTKIMDLAGEKAKAEAAATAAATAAARRAPQSRVQAGRLMEWDPDNRRWIDKGPSEGPPKPKEPTEPKLQWVTDVTTKPPRRVQVSDAEIAAHPEKYSDLRPPTQRYATISSGQMMQARASAAQVLGSPTDKNQDSIWNLAKKLSSPGPTMIAGPLGVAGRTAGNLLNRAGLAPDVDLYTTQIKGFIPLFARAVGHTGTLTEKDVQRTELLFPRIGDTTAVARRKLERLQAVMNGQAEVPAGLWEPQAGHWPPGEAAPEGQQGPGSELTPEEEALFRRHGIQ